MILRTVRLALVLVGLMFAQLGWAGIYTTIDLKEETRRYSRDYEEVFSKVWGDLLLIPAPVLERGQLGPAIRRRYMLIETMGGEGTVHLKTVEQKLNYSAVLMRRDKAYEATNVLLPLTKEHPGNFLVWAQFALANFLSGNADFRGKAPQYMEQALDMWPTSWDKVDDDLKRFLADNYGWEETEFVRMRRYEEYLLRLMRHRIREEARGKRLTDPIRAVMGFAGRFASFETVDPIFRDESDKDKNPVRFLDENGKFSVGRIARAEKDKLPPDSVEAVEQLLIWMPTDKRLLWLLAETFNASAMEHKDDKERNKAIRSAYLIFLKLNDPLNMPTYGRADIESHFGALAKDAGAQAVGREITLPKDFDKEKELELGLDTLAWWRTIAVGFATGLAVGMFALWQIQEVRRRRQGR